MHAARQARVERADRAHDVDAAEVVRVGLLEDRHAVARVLVRAGRAVGVGRRAVPRRRRIRVVVGDLAVADDHVVREHAAHRLVEAAADRVVRDVEVLERLRPPGADLLERLVEEVERAARGVGDEVDPRAVALDRVGPLRDLPLEVDLGRVRRLGQRDLHASDPVALTHGMWTLLASAVAHSRASAPPPVSIARLSPVRWSYQRGLITHE